MNNYKWLNQIKEKKMNQFLKLQNISGEKYVLKNVLFIPKGDGGVGGGMQANRGMETVCVTDIQEAAVIM